MMQKRIAYLELYFCKVFRYKYFCKKLYFGHCNLSTYKDLLERYLPERIKSFVRYLQIMVGQKHTLIGHLILLQIFPSDRISGMFFVWLDNFRIWLDIVRCSTVILRPDLIWAAIQIDIFRFLCFVFLSFFKK